MNPHKSYHPWTVVVELFDAVVAGVTMADPFLLRLKYGTHIAIRHLL
jgi:hypothetical protein